MKASLYLTDYEKEVIKNETFYKLKFFDSINGLVFVTYIHEKGLYTDITGKKINDYISLIDNGNSEVIERLKKEIL